MRGPANSSLSFGLPLQGSSREGRLGYIQIDGVNEYRTRYNDVRREILFPEMGSTNVDSEHVWHVFQGQASRVELFCSLLSVESYLI